MNPAHDESRDAHLRQALRHAPDAHLQAPSALGDVILKEARAKARDPRPAARPEAAGSAHGLWGWLARPAVATGFAGVMAATLVGLMWWDQPMDEALPRSLVPVAAPPAADRAAAASTPVISAAPSATPAVPPKVLSPKPEPARKTAGADASATAAPQMQGMQGAPGASVGGVAMDKAAEEAPPTLRSSPAPAPAAPLAADTVTGATPPTESKREAPQREHAAMARSENFGRRAAAKAELNESRLQLEAEAYTRVASVRAAIAAEPARWSWQRSSAAAQPMNDDVYAWLAQLDGSAGTGWQPRDAQETAAPKGRLLALLREGQTLHSFQLTERGVLWQRGQSSWHVPLPAETLASLQAALDKAAP